MPRIAGVDPGQALDARGEVVFGVRPIHDPPARAPPVARGISPAAVILRQVRIFEAKKMKLRGALGDECFVFFPPRNRPL